MGVIQKTFAVGALLAAAGGAWAATASASLSNIQIQLFDLTPGDGVAPSFKVLSGGNNYTNAYTRSGLDLSDDASPSAVHLIAAGLDLAATSNGTGVNLGSYSLTAAASDTALGIYGDAYTFGRAHFQVEVGAGTLVLVTVHSSVAADVRGAVNGTYAQGSSQVDFFNYNRSDGTTTQNHGALQAEAGVGYLNLSPSYTDLVSASFANFGANSVTQLLGIYVNAGVTSPMVPVPEPSSAAMLLSGLGVAFGLAFRRRERRA